jgi:hypothetical protein
MGNDRYFGSLATHALTRDPRADGFAGERDALLEALGSGRCYLAMDWHRPATGFRFWAEDGDRRVEMGQEASVGTWTLRAQSPYPATIRLIREGIPIAIRSESTAIEVITAAPGSYRVETWLPSTAGELCWILSNPIYLRGQGGKRREGE